MKTQNTGLRKLLEDQVASMYFAEKQLVKALGNLAIKAGNGELQDAFAGHLEETKGHVKRLERVFKYLNKIPQEKQCPAINGIIAEGSDMMEEFSTDPALDAGLIAAAQKAEHYEIAT